MAAGAISSSAGASIPSLLRSNARTPEAAAEQFEAVFLAQMLKPVFSGIAEGAAFSGGAGERAFAPVLTDAYAQAMAKSGGIGIADAVLAEILRIQGGG